MATRSVRRPANRERIFYASMGLIILALVFAGFAPTYFLRGIVDAGRPLPPMSPLVHLHGIVFSAWVVLFITQTALITGRQHKLHMKFGYAAAGLAAAMVGVGLLTGIRQMQRGSNPGDLPPEMWFALPFWSIAAFAILVGAGLAFRKTAQVHKRLMLLATIGMLQPAIGRMTFPFELLGPETNALVAFLMATPLIAWDAFQRRRIHPATMFGISILAAEQLIRVATWHTAGWQSFAYTLGELLR